MGYSILPDRDGSLSIRYDTCYRGKYYEHYYVFLKKKDDDDNDDDNDQNKIKIIAHTLPNFIPLVSIRDLYLHLDFRLFNESIIEYLNSYVSRREQLNQLEKCKAIEISQVDTNRPLSSITIFAETYASKKNRSIKIKLRYQDMTSSHPSSVEILKINEDGSERPILFKLAPLFMKYSLLEACEIAFLPAEE
eukprot:TRINITY_DN7262_c0_g1_i1.p1 TRINITY_DN7262_c0_g1~~TRINITY_DN7262_c0_g1_i1.p1  ORF type:complete len:206 (-),score=31.36 TRINITY_DN7262_c0_g1_i1:33-608(-)